jgi:hypothetical protein
MSRKTVWQLAIAIVLACGTCAADPIIISGVPAYYWYGGCGPTAAASIIGYWDQHGYSNLFDASGSDVFLTAKVQDQISSPAHNAKYNLTPGDPNLPASPETSVADFFNTSNGWSYQNYADAAFTGYAASRGYQVASSYDYFYSGFSWNRFTDEINAGRPMMFLVDITGSGSSDHFVPVVGYDDRGAEGLWYGMYTTWSESETVVWEPFRGIQSGNPWGIAYGTFVTPLDSAVPEPTTFVLAMTVVGLVGIAYRRRLAANPCLTALPPPVRLSALPPARDLPATGPESTAPRG